MIRGLHVGDHVQYRDAWGAIHYGFVTTVSPYHGEEDGDEHVMISVRMHAPVRECMGRVFISSSADHRKSVTRIPASTHDLEDID